MRAETRWVEPEVAHQGFHLDAHLVDRKGSRCAAAAYAKQGCDVLDGLGHRVAGVKVPESAHRIDHRATAREDDGYRFAAQVLAILARPHHEDGV